MNIQDIAKMAGVSASTVSKVINGKDKDISEATRERVMKIVEETNYMPWIKFREKESLQSHLLGMIIHKNCRERERMIEAVDSEANKQGYHLAVHFVDTDAEIPVSLEAMEQRKVSGVLIDSDIDIPLGRMENRTIFLGQSHNRKQNPKIYFYYSMTEAGRQATEQLIKAGHTKIACVVEEGNKRILEGYQHAMRDADLQVKPAWIYEGKTLDDIETLGFRQCFSEQATAFVCGSGEIACRLWKTIQLAGGTIPERYSVVVIGDDHIMNILGSGITAIDFPIEAMCVDAVKCLVKMLQSEKQMEGMRRFPLALKERASVGCPETERQGGKIVVVGSMNLDITVEVSRIPVNGETQIAERVLQFPGGKGGNQAVGIGKLGGQAYMIGCLGYDVDGRMLYNVLMENHVHMDGVSFDSTMGSGKAYINVDRNGESTIVVYPGANNNLDIAHINRCKHLFKDAKYCLLSLEIAPEVAEYTIKYCQRNHTEVILKPSNVENIKEGLLKDIAYFVPNENELHVLVPGSDTLENKAQWLLDKGVQNVIVTLGSRGCYLKNNEYSLYFPGTDFDAVDTTGGADSFISALATYLSEDKPLLLAIGYAVYASGITVTRYGVQPALPDRQAVGIYEDEIRAKYNLNRREENK